MSSPSARQARWVDFVDLVWSDSAGLVLGKTLTYFGYKSGSMNVSVELATNVSSQLKAFAANRNIIYRTS